MIHCIMTIPVWIQFLLFISLILFMRSTVQSKRQKKSLPPGPPKLPTIGNLHQLGRLPHQSLWNLSKKYGPVIHLQLGTIPTVVVSSPESAREVLKYHDSDCCSRPQLAGTKRLSYNYLDIAFSPYGDYWRNARKICVLELFGTKHVQSFRSIREEEIALLINSISNSASSKTPVNLSEKLLSLTASVTCKAAFGMSFRGSAMDNDRFLELIHEAVAMLGSFSASDFFPYAGCVIDWFMGLRVKHERSFRDLDALFEEAIDVHLENRKTGEGHEDIVDVLLKLQREETEIGSTRLTKDHIKAILMDIFVGGVDTSGISMTWAMAELARNPRVMRKVQSEIRDKIGTTGKINQEDIDQLGYLKLVIKETWRLHPPTPLLIPREVLSEFKINYHTIRPKTRLQVNVWGMGRDPSIWKLPEAFFPERFIDNPIDLKGQNFELLPFGGGRRICPGMYMGTVIVELVLANLLYRFDWKLPEGMMEKDIDVEEAPGLTVHKKVPLELVPIEFQAT